MDNVVYESIKRYFTSLSMFGYKSYNDTYKLLYIISIRDFIYNDFRELITEDDYRIIEKSLYNVFGTTCLLPYPGSQRASSISLFSSKNLPMPSTTIFLFITPTIV